MTPVNIAVLVSGGGTNLQALIDAQNSGELINGRIALVISSNPDAYALKRAENAGIPTEIIPCSRRDRDTYSKDILDMLSKYSCSLVALCGFMYILSGEFCRTYQNAIINVHPSLVPAFCGEGYYGLKVHKAVLEYGAKVTGATVHFVDSVCDGGPIILQKCVEVLDDDTPEKLQRRVMEQAEWNILPRAVSLFCQEKLKIEGRIVKVAE